MSISNFLIKALTPVSLFLGTSGYASEGLERAGKSSALSEPMLAQSLETIERKIYAVGRAPGRLVIAPDHENFVITTPFVPTGTSRELVFGNMIDSKRIGVGDKKELYSWRAFFPLGNRVLAFEGNLLMFLELDSSNFTEIIRRTIPWDTVRPPRDRGGEPTTIETAQFRANFKKAMLATKGLKVSGLAPIPRSWIKNGKSNYLVLSRLEKFPFLLLECDKETPSLCVFTRGCNVEKKFKTKISDLRGIGISESRKLIYIGDPVAKAIHSFKFSSCYSVRQTGSRALPKKIKTLSNLSIDSDNRLFITTEDPDDFLNASLFFWNDSQW